MLQFGALHGAAPGEDHHEVDPAVGGGRFVRSAARGQGQLEADRARRALQYVRLDQVAGKGQAAGSGRGGRRRGRRGGRSGSGPSGVGHGGPGRDDQGQDQQCGFGLRSFHEALLSSG